MNQKPQDQMCEPLRQSLLRRPGCLRGKDGFDCAGTDTRCGTSAGGSHVAAPVNYFTAVCLPLRTVNGASCRWRPLAKLDRTLHPRDLLVS